MSQVFDETTLVTWQGHLAIGEAPTPPAPLEAVVRAMGRIEALT